MPPLLFVYFLSTEIFYPSSTRRIKFWFLDTCAGYLSKILTACWKIVGTSGEWAPIRQQPCCVNLFSKYLAYELLNSPVSWQDLSCVHIFSFPRFWTFCTECFAFYHFDCVTVKTNDFHLSILQAFLFLQYISCFEVLFENHIFYEKVSSIKMIITGT